MSDCQSQSLSSSVHLSEPLSILWTLGGWPSGCKLFTSSHTLPALLRLPFWSCFLSVPLSIWWHEVFRATQTAWTHAQYRTDIWALLAAKTMSSLHGPWYWGHISKDWWATWVWRSYFEMLSERERNSFAGLGCAPWRSWTKRMKDLMYLSLQAQSSVESFFCLQTIFSVYPNSPRLPVILAGWSKWWKQMM